MKHFTNGVFLIKIRPISKETMTNFNFQRNSFVIKPLTTVRFSKPDIFVFKKIKLQTYVSPKLNWFSLVFNFVGKRNFLSTKCICFGSASIERHPLQSPFVISVSSGPQRAIVNLRLICATPWPECFC